MQVRQVSIFLADAAATSAVARHIAPSLGVGDTVLLQGPIGAGKTHFARSVIQHLLAKDGVAEDVPSPTFTLVQTYQAGPLPIWHADLYRLAHPQDVLDLGLDEAVTTALCLIEWPDRMGKLLPNDALHLEFAPTPDDQRVLVASAAAARWQSVLAGLEAWHRG